MQLALPPLFSHGFFYFRVYAPFDVVGSLPYTTVQFDAHIKLSISNDSV